MKHKIAIAMAALVLSSACFSKPPADPAAKPPEDLLKLPQQQGGIDLLSKPSAKDLFEKSYNSDNSTGSSNLSDDVFPKLEKLIAAHDYSALDKFIDKHLKDAKLAKWLEKKSNEGQVHLMWFLAEHYARNNTIDLAVKWSYAAIFGTLQESKLCLDRNIFSTAAGFIAQSHPNLLRITRANPFLIKDAKIFAMSVLTKANGYVDPTAWLCMPYTTEERKSKGDSVRYAYDEVYFPLLRARARNTLRETYQVEQAMETPPAMPPKPAPAANGPAVQAPPVKP